MGARAPRRAEGASSSPTGTGHVQLGCPHCWDWALVRRWLGGHTNPSTLRAHLPTPRAVLRPHPLTRPPLRSAFRQAPLPPEALSASNALTSLWRKSVAELLPHPCSYATPIIEALTPHMSSRDAGVAATALRVIGEMAELAGDRLLPYVPTLLPQLHQVRTSAPRRRARLPQPLPMLGGRVPPPTRACAPL